MIIRKYRLGEELLLSKLFYETIHKINIKDYNNKQINAWAPDNSYETSWIKRIKGINPFVCELDGEIVAYADIQNNGYIDHFFVSKDHQNIGLGSKLLSHLIEEANKKTLKKVYTHSSITAMPFFKKFGFTIVKEQEVEIRGVILKNYIMELYL